jgi:hypothetical protein
VRIKIIGAGYYGLSIGLGLKNAGHKIEIHELRSDIMQGASGNIPARLHAGFHYPRSYETRAACRAHNAEFMARYGDLTDSIPVNIYAIAADTSMVDYPQYQATMTGEVPFIDIPRPAEFGLHNVAGAMLTGERHIVTSRAKAYFADQLAGDIHFESDDRKTYGFDWMIDCTFCASDWAGVDRYEPCVVLLLEGNADKAVTIMDGPLPSLYPWDRAKGLCSLSSALWTPISKSIKTYAQAKAALDNFSNDELADQCNSMIDSMAFYYPEIREYKQVGVMKSVRAMPLSGADTRLIDVAVAGPKLIRIRAGKIDAVIAAERAVREIIGD